METVGQPLPPRGPAAMEQLRERHEAVTAGQQDPRELQLEALVRWVRSALGPPPSDPVQQEAWLTQAGEALLLLSELCAIKAERLAPTPAPALSSPSGQEEGAWAAGDGTGGGGEGASQDLAGLGDAARWFEGLQAAAEALAKQAEAFSVHQPRPQASALMDSLRLLGPWPDGAPGVNPEDLARVLQRVLQRHALAEAARHAPAPSLDWASLLKRIRERVQAETGVDLGELVASGADRAEVIAIFLAVLELVRVGELWLVEEAEAIRVRRRSPTN